MAMTDKQGKTGKKSSGLFSSFRLRGREEEELPATGSKFEITIEDMHKKYSAMVISRMQILNVNSLIVRRDIDRDETIKKAEVIALGVIEDNLHDRDAFVHNDVGVYGFLLPGMSKKSAELKCQVIADQIARLINDADPQLLNLEFEAKARKRRAGRFADLVATKKKAPAVANAAPDPQRQRELEEQKTKANLAFQQMTLRSRNDIGGRLLEPATWWDGNDEPRPGERGLPEGMDTMFRAMWNVRNKLLTAYSALPVLRDAKGRIESIIRVDPDNGMYAVAAACDRLIQDEALKKLHMLLDAGHKVLLVLPVHFSTVDRYDYFVPYQQRLKKLNDKQRQLVVQEVVGIPADVNKDRIRESVTRLRQASRSVMARVSLSGSGLRAWRDVGVHAVGFDFAESQASERALVSEMNRFADRADEAGLKKFVYGLMTPSAASAAVAAGYDYIEGNAVRPPVDSPAYVEPFESLDLFKSLFRR